MSATAVKVKVWDISTRLFHWLLLLLFAGLWLTAEQGEMQWHQVLAYCLLILIIFRLLWGFIGSDTARFTAFVVPPSKALAYLTANPKPRSLGHNPLGGYMVLLMLGLLLIQLVSGLFSTDEVFTEGPLFSLVDESVALGLTWLHKTNFNILLVCAAVHVLAVFIYWFNGENLIKPMLTGYKELSEQLTSSNIPKMKSTLMALILLAVLALPVWFYLLKPVLDYI
ncbi:cytochrome b/b6 domain-containing protein [Shewanella sp. SR44-3]|uniref:cytochrome b/b6 domain-containing protein n=1 Tax=Shewanella sp. SR44-3 TaxID=2760936 RepID=UPI0015F7FE32|nr:cytochrome b/b6 domain-containing protein [Shewanella sp. SR44-3]MBB1269215.1 cytochrome b/b6 domain-containing protein [Shewanella sp. SR44-3]